MNSTTLCLIFTLLVAHSAMATTRYVDLNASGANNGTSWTNAYPSLQSALSAANAGDQILVASGTYLPSVDESGNASPTNPRTKTFFINKNISLFGGYKVSGGVLETRDIDDFPSKLSGDIGTPNNVSDNCYHVILFENVSNACRLDGVYIQEGQANGGDPTQKRGAGAYLRATAFQTSPEISNCRVTENTGTEGAVYLDIYDNDDNTKLTNCLFTGNFGGTTSAFHSRIGGITTQNLQFDNCIFTKNTGAGAVIRLVAVAESFADSTIDFNNCSVAGNVQATTPIIQPETITGGAILLRGRNSVFHNPLAATTEIMATTPNSNTTIDLDYCFLEEANCAAITQTGTTVTCSANMFYNTDPQFFNLSTGNLRPVTGSPVIDAGNPATSTSEDYRGVPRPPLPGPDIGAYEFPKNTPQLTSRLNAQRNMVLKWSCLTGETYSIRRTRDFIDYETFVTGYPSGGTKAWSLELISNSVDIPSIPRLFYQVVRE